LVFAPPAAQRRAWRWVTAVHGREKGQEEIYGRAARGQKRRVAAINTKLALEIPAQKAIADLGGDFGASGAQRSAFRLAAQILPNFPDATEYKAQRENSQHSTKPKDGRHRNPLSKLQASISMPHQGLLNGYWSSGVVLLWPCARGGTHTAG